MFFQESETIVRKHPDLQHVTELVDTQLSTILSPSPLRPGDFACVIECDENQVVSVFELFEQEGILASSEMVECERCHNLMSAVAFLQAIEDEDDFECSSCQRSFRKRTELTVVYRMTASTLARSSPNVPAEHQSKESVADADRGPQLVLTRADEPTIDFDTFAVHFLDKSCELRNTKEFALFERLSRRPGQFFSIDVLIHDVWGDELIEKNTVQRTASNLRKKLSDAGFDGVEIDGTTNRGHYALKLAGQ